MFVCLNVRLRVVRQSGVLYVVVVVVFAKHTQLGTQQRIHKTTNTNIYGDEAGQKVRAQQLGRKIIHILPVQP